MISLTVAVSPASSFNVSSPLSCRSSSALALLQEIKQDYGTTVVVVTHNAKLALLADRVIRLSDGQILENSVNETPAKAGEIEW